MGGNGRDNARLGKEAPLLHRVRATLGPLQVIQSKDLKVKPIVGRLEPALANFQV